MRSALQNRLSAKGQLRAFTDWIAVAAVDLCKQEAIGRNVELTLPARITT